VLLFAILAVEIKRKAPTTHTCLEIVKARWGTTAHLVFLVFCLITNIIVTSMLILGGAWGAGQFWGAAWVHEGKWLCCVTSTLHEQPLYCMHSVWWCLASGLASTLFGAFTSQIVATASANAGSDLVLTTSFLCTLSCVQVLLWSTP
jgi:hypothetical protein